MPRKKSEKAIFFKIASKRIRKGRLFSKLPEKESEKGNFFQNSLKKNQKRSTFFKIASKRIRKGQLFSKLPEKKSEMYRNRFSKTFPILDHDKEQIMTERKKERMFRSRDDRALVGALGCAIPIPILITNPTVLYL